MDYMYAAEMEGELLLIGLIAIIGAFLYHKLDKMMQLQEKSNELLEKIVNQGKKEEKKED